MSIADQPPRASDPQPLVEPFPHPEGSALVLAIRELDLALNGTAEQRRSVGDPALLPKPWIPATCTKPVLRTDLWNWLEQVVTWLNHETVFDPIDTIPPCWPRHPHLVHEIAVLADLRRRADLSLTSDPLEEWNRYALPAFLDRMKHRVGDHCTQHHPATWPAAGRLSRHLSSQAAKDRRDAFVNDIEMVRDADQAERSPASSSDTRLRLVGEASGELLD